ncbi:hypothetical protein QBC39DRAFT_157712 [Podospora conica]|nr:hypothetical protein QBC39DRAFT_157712 [Schizothecium conicum]
MSIARAFTTRKARQGLDGDSSVPHRSHTTKNSGSIRHKISAPVELIFTTNQLSYNAPDIFPKTSRSISTGSSHRSDDDLSDSATNVSSPPTSPDLDSPKRTLSPEPNHLSCYFTPPLQTQSPVPSVAPLSPAPAASVQSPATSTRSRRPPPPMIPERAASHAKKPYDGLVRQRSSSRMSEQSQQTLSSKGSFSFSRSSSASTAATSSSQYTVPPQHKAKVSGSYVNSSSSSHRPSASQSSQSSRGHKTDFSQAQHPFGLELAQVSEIAEEYGVKEKLNELETEEKELVAKGLNKFTAEDYLGEINSLISSFFTDANPMPPAALWI